jgi:23S rRNA (guanosine2251-2'-O)-methyltransferase
MRFNVVFGFHAVTAVLEKSATRVQELFVNDERIDARLSEVLALAKSKGIMVKRLSHAELSKRCPEGQHQGVVAICQQAEVLSEQDIPNLLAVASKPPLILILDGITDPHNLGACMRSADATGVDFIIVPKDKAVGITPVVSKVASGAAESVPLVQVVNLVRAMEILKEAGVWLFGAAGEATESIYQHRFEDACAIVLGREGEGMRRLTKAHCDHLFRIPMMGTVESLNVSVATGVTLYEVRRQRLSSRTT